jgi:amino-acid N-acetyltransferase
VQDGVDFEHTGLVRRIDTEAMSDHLDDGSIVLLSPIGYSPTGEVFNVSAEDVATQTAIALQADKLIVFTAEEGLLDSQGELVRHADISQAKQLLAQQQRDNALLRAMINSGENGVKRCHCISFCEDGALLQELFTRDGSGTLLAQDHYEQLRTATIDDVGGILELIQPLEQEGTLVKRSRELLETEIDRFTVIERDGMIIACAALYPYPDEYCGELACVATHADYRGGNRGQRLLTAIRAEARHLGLSQLFVLTTVTAHWFQEQGFVEANTQMLPEAKQQLYNFQRNSKVFTLAL